MGVDVFEVGLYKPRVPGDGSNEPEMLPRVWDRETLLRSIGWLCFQNAHGRNIYVRPKGEHHLSLVDDLTAGAIERMKADGFAPAVIVESSPGNFQAWLKHGQILDEATSTRAANLLASFIIIPMTLLIQGESAIMFLAPDADSPNGIGSLWAIITGMMIVVILLLRVGNSLFNRVVK